MIKNKPRDLPFKEKPFAGMSNTDKRVDTGAPHDITERDFDKNNFCFGVQSRPREFQAFHRYLGSERGMTTKPVNHEVIRADGGEISSLAYHMESQGIKFK